MSSDIDIEEHDLLDHPRIRQIFPDIASLKTEVEEMYQEETIDIEEDYTYYKPGPSVISPKPFNNKIIIGSKPSTSTSHYQGPSSQETESLEASYEEAGLQETSFEETGIRETSFEETGIQETSFEETGIQETSFEENVFEVQSENDKVLPEDNKPDQGILKTLLQEQWLPNKIMLGTKTVSSTSSESDSDDEELDYKLNLKTYVLVKDCGNFLQNNPCFCRDCEVLFPSSADLDVHKMTSHSLLVAVSRNKAVKSTSKNSDDHKSLICNHCNVKFPDTLSLLKHTYELLPGKKNESKFACDDCDLVFDNDAAYKEHNHEIHKQSALIPKGLFLICKICSCHFKRFRRLEMHMLKCHYITKIEPVQPVQTDLQCRFCQSYSKSPKNYNEHIYKNHLEMYISRHYEVSKFRCPQCNMCFSSDYSVRIHLAVKHGHLGSGEDSKKMGYTLEKPLKIKDVPTFSKLPPKPVKQKKYPQNITKTRPVPKSTLFKCNKCHVHYVTCVNAVLHSSTCVPTSKKGSYSCQQCKRTFRIPDKIYHDYQHSISEKFKVIVISRNILNRILCKCKVCGVCFDENSFMALHTSSCNADTSSVQCKECKLWIHSKAIAVHRKIHKNGLTPKDFIVTEYVHAVKSIKEQIKPVVVEKLKEDSMKTIKTSSKNTTVNKLKQGAAKTLKVGHKHAAIKNIIKRFKKKWYYYCPTCKCCMRCNKASDKHDIGKCNTRINTVTCKQCGLKFTKKSFNNHQELHKMFPKLKLKELKFINIQNGDFLNPPMPDFKKCTKCNVTFFSATAISKHACRAAESKTCSYCKEKFSDLAFKLHVGFHEYAKNNEHEEQKINDNKITTTENIPELIKKYKSLKQVWNILYLCQSCDIVIDTYDQVVQHCQDHFSNMQSYNVTIEHCDLCDLKFVENCFERHKKLHLNNDRMDKDSFIILEYKYENLLSDSWMDMFKNLTKEQIQLILSKSMYKFTRCTRMRVVSNGSFGLTLYQCAQCNLIVAPNKVMEHSQNLNNICEDAKTFACSMCTLKFVYKSQKIVHENLHELRKLNAKSFKIIEFQADKQLFSVTEAKNQTDKKKNDHEELKFIRCQHCGKLINKQKYKSHILYHEYYNNKYKIKSKPMKQSINKMKQIKPTSNKIFNFYVCKECKMCVAKETIKVHICDPNAKTKKCGICSLLFRAQNLYTHYKSHEMKNFTRSNMKVMYFEGEVIYKKPISKPFYEGKRFDNKSLTLYQCAKCGICIWNKMNIVRHGCTPPERQFKCNLCGFAFRNCSRKPHKEMHNHRQIDRNNVTVFKFNDINIIKPKSSNPIAHKRKLPNSEEVDAKRPKVHNREPLRPYQKVRKFVTNQEKVAKTVKTDSRTKMSVEEFVHHVSNRYYKCKTCKLLFVGLTDLIDHEDSCATHRDAVKCSQCGLVFHASNIMKHLNSQECNLHTKHNVYMITVQQKGIDHSKNSNWIAYCVNCGVYNISPGGFQYHLKNRHQIKYAIHMCEICNIKFTSTSHKMHLQMHHGVKQTDISELSIASIEDTTLFDALKDLPDNKDVLYIDYKTALELFSYNSKEKITINPIQTCDVCGLSFVHPRSLQRHQETNKHDEYRESCNVCGFSFTPLSLKRHMVIHHVNNTDNNETTSNTQSESVSYESQSIPSLIRVDEDNMSAISVGRDDGYNEKLDSTPTNSNFDKSTNDNDAKTTEEVNEIFNCDVCDINFLTEASLIRHKKINKHNEVQYTCTECGLIFSFVSIKKHMEIHHPNIKMEIKRITKSKSNIDLNGSVLESIPDIFGQNKPSTSLIQNDINNTKNGIPDNNTETGNENLNTAEDIVKTPRSIENNNAKTDSIDNVTPSRSIGNVVTNENNIGTETLNKNKLFKCNICNVYFLTSNDCSDHMTNHVQLDTYEYIACKMCNLQFCCEFLGRHMKTHREKTFCTDDLIVAEYFLDTDEVTIDTYLFLGRLKTKQISTTSNLEIELVDSTTTENTESQASKDA